MIGIGKTTICKKLASMMEEQSYKFDGFYTEEVRNENGSRIGFDIVLAKNLEKRSTLARAELVFTCNCKKFNATLYLTPHYLQIET